MTWQRVPLKDVGEWYGGGTPSKSNLAYWTDGIVPWLSPKDMGREVLTGTRDLITGAAVDGSAARLVPGPSVAVVTRSGILERTIPVALVPFDTTLNQDMKAVVPREGIDPRWIAWGLRAFERDLLRGTRKAGTTVASIDMQRFLEFTLPVPSIEEQRPIIGLLEDHLSRLDAGNNAVNVSQRRAKNLNAVAMSLATSHDEVLPLGELAVGAGYGTSTKCSHDGSGMPVARIPNVVNGRIDMRDEKRAIDKDVDLTGYSLRRGDLLVIRTNGSRNLIGRSAVVDRDMQVAFASYLIRFSLDTERVRPEWVQLTLSSPGPRRTIERMAASSAGQYNLSLKKLNELPIPCPPLAIQDRLLERVTSQKELVDRGLGLASAAAIRSENLRTSLLEAAFSGRLTGSVNA